MATSPRRIAVLFGGPSPEHDVSVLTGLQAVRALDGAPGIAEVYALYWSKTGTWHEVAHDVEGAAFANGVPSSTMALELSVGPDGGFGARKGRISSRLEMLQLDAALNCCHGGPGEDGSLQAVLDLVGLSYSGPTAASAALGMDKLSSYAVLHTAGIAALPRVLLSHDSAEPPFPAPYIVKPRYGGSSIGIEVVSDFATARARLDTSVHLGHGAVLEPYRPDLFDLQIAVRTWPKPVLSAIERPIRNSESAEILGYSDKYVGGEGMVSAARELPAHISDSLADVLRSTALIAAELLGARGVNRIDFLSDGKLLFANEINTIPGSLSRYLFIDPPLAFETLLLDLLSEACERPAAVFSTAGADGVVLRRAGSIASKLA